MGLILQARNEWYIKSMNYSYIEKYNKESFKSNLLTFLQHFCFQLAEMSVVYKDWDTTNEKIQESDL